MANVVIKTTEALTNRVHSEERMCGKRARFHVYHQTPSGKTKRFDISYADTADEAAADMVQSYKELGSKIEVMFVVPLNQNITID